MDQNTALLWICRFVILFFLFSCAGWGMEVLLKLLQYRRLINRGFLIGPYCPIYGFGAVLIILLLNGLLGREGTVGETFLAGMAICGGLEYATSWYMEKMFHARWWDYSQKPMNLHGRIWIGNLLLFGLASVLIQKLIAPHLLVWLSHWPDALIKWSALGVIVLMGADCILSHALMGRVRKEIDAQPGDNTEEISKRIRAVLQDRGMLLRRIQAAYPHAQARSKRLIEQFQQARHDFRQAKRKAKAAAKQAAKAALDAQKAMRSAASEDWAKRMERAEAQLAQCKQALQEAEARLFGRKKD